MSDRITLSRAAGYRRPEGTIQVDRVTIYGNPWQVGDPGIWWMPREDGKAGWHGYFHMPVSLDNAAAVALYQDWLLRDTLPAMPRVLSSLGRIAMGLAMDARREAILTRLPTLTGHPLGCRCAQGEPCHGDVLVEEANR